MQADDSSHSARSRDANRPSTIHHRIAGSLGLALLLTGATSSIAGAQAVVSASPDITIALGTANLTTADEAIAVDNQQGIVALENVGSIPASADLIAYGQRLDGTRLLSFDTAVSLSGGVVARPGDVVGWNGSVHSMVFDATAQGVPIGVRTDAVSIATNGLILSFDVDVSLPGNVTVADEDLVKWNGAVFTRVLDGSAAGVDRSLDVDGAQDIGGGFLVSFDASGSVGGITFNDEDILRYVGGVWSLAFDGSAADADWVAADLDAFQVPEPASSAMLGAGLVGLSIAAARRAPRRIRGQDRPRTSAVQ